MTDKATVRPMARHYFVGLDPAMAPQDKRSSNALARTCRRRGCGLPPEHPVHLKPAGDDFDTVPAWVATG